MLTLNESESKKARTAYRLLYIGFIALPIIVGLDKFADYIVDWQRYLAPIFPQTLSISAEAFMRIVGVIEIAAGILVAWKPARFAYLVAVWFLLIIINFFIIGGYYDIALRDLGLMLGAIALGLLASAGLSKSNAS
jgi:hypothetical protein